MLRLAALFLTAALTLVLGSPTALAAKGDVLFSFPVQGCAVTGLGWDGRHIWSVNGRVAGNCGSPCSFPSGCNVNRVVTHNVSDGAAVGFFDIPEHYHSLTFDHDGNIWTDSNWERLVKLSDTGTVAFLWDEDKLQNPCDGCQGLPEGLRTHGVAYDLSGQRLMVLNWSDPAHTLYTLDPSTGETIAEQPLTFVPDAKTESLGSMVWDGTHLWVYGLGVDGDDEQRTLYRMDVSDGSQVDSIVFPRPLGGVTYDGRCLWVVDKTMRLVSQVDPGQSDLPECSTFVPPPDAGVITSPDAGGVVGPDGGSAANSDAGDGSGGDAGCCGAGGASQGAGWCLLALAVVTGLRRRRPVC